LNHPYKSTERKAFYNLKNFLLVGSLNVPSAKPLSNPRIMGPYRIPIAPNT